MRIKNIIFAAMLLVGIVSCKEDEVELFSGPTMASINLINPDATAWQQQLQSYFVPFASNPELTEMKIDMECRISGMKSSSVRVVKLDITGDANKDNYEIPSEVTIPANELYVKLPITFKKPNGADAGRENILTIKLVQNESFVEGPLAKIILDFGLIPSDWIGDGKGMAEMVLGKCSKLKYRIYFDAVGSFDVPGGFGVWNAYIIPAKYLKEYNENPEKFDNKYGDVPVKDENGVIAFQG